MQINTKLLSSLDHYNPNRLLDAIIEKLQLKNDAALSRALEVAPPVISKIRHYTLPIGATILLRMHEISDMSIREMRELMSYKEPDDGDMSGSSGNPHGKGYSAANDME